MSLQLPENSPCSCGSGKKYKNCCLPREQQKETTLEGEYKFEPGSYQYKEQYLPSIACLKSAADDRWQYLFLILKSATNFIESDGAAQMAIADLQAALEHEQSGDFEGGMAEYLKSIGYENAPGYYVNDNNLKR